MLNAHIPPPSKNEITHLSIEERHGGVADKVGKELVEEDLLVGGEGEGGTEDGLQVFKYLTVQ